jgi:hypothetical protein
MAASSSSSSSSIATAALVDSLDTGSDSAGTLLRRENTALRAELR